MGDTTTTSEAAQLAHPHLTTMGLFMEAQAGLALSTLRRLEAEHGIGGQWFEVLIRLARTPGHRLRMSDLAAQTTLSASGLTRVVDRLVAQGLVDRQACPSDRRGSFAVLTPAGEARILAAVPTHLAQLTEIFEGTFSPSELDTFTALMRRLRDAVNPEAERASRPTDPADA